MFAADGNYPVVVPYLIMSTPSPGKPYWQIFPNISSKRHFQPVKTNALF